MNYIGNAFSLQMITEKYYNLKVTEILPEEIPHNVVSVVGHDDTSKVLSNMLGFNVAFNRQSLVLTKDDVLYVAQIKGGRLPEGTTTLPDGVTISFFKVYFS